MFQVFMYFITTFLHTLLTPESHKIICEFLKDSGILALPCEENCEIQEVEKKCDTMELEF